MKLPIFILLAGLGAVCAETHRFSNRGVLAGFTGGNQRSKISESHELDFDGNATSLKCLMVRTEPDTPNQGCHAEVHLARFPDGTHLGLDSGFRSTTTYQIRFDRNCDAASVGFFQYKNHDGPEQWKYLVALWRLPGKNGREIHFQINPTGKSDYRYAALSATQGTALVADRWHEVRVNGNFTDDASGWVEISINGKLVEWFHDRNRKQAAGTRVTGPLLPQLPGSAWQLQLGGYGFFKDQLTDEATVWIDNVGVHNALPPSQTAAQWPEVKRADFSKILPDHFFDAELEVPEFLFHFPQVANAVVEEGKDRGFLALAVNRDPKDNKPYNARIMEMHMALAYFYTTGRPWNPYRGDPAVRLRLEAMLDRWTRIQNSDGLFAEYSPDNWSLAPTGFGAMAAARTLDLLIEGDQPFDGNLIERARLSLRRALMALFTHPALIKSSRIYSNQFSGAYYATAVYLKHWPDKELPALFEKASARAIADHQSPAGFFYEKAGSDFGYSGVHENNLRAAWPLLRDDPAVTPELIHSHQRWNDWLSYNYLPIPDSDAYALNAGVQTRTSLAIAKPQTLVLSEVVPVSRAMATTREAYLEGLIDKRILLARQWGKWPELKIPGSGSYIPTFVHAAAGETAPWHPSAAQREAARLALPPMLRDHFTHQRHDPRPYTFTYRRRPTYYAAFNSGKIEAPGHQAYGLGLLWNPAFGPAMQSIPKSSDRWGTILGKKTTTVEQTDLMANFLIEGKAIDPAEGARDLPEGDLEIRYALGKDGDKQINFTHDSITVRVTSPGAFQEILPLLCEKDSMVDMSDNQLQILQHGVLFKVEVAERDAKIQLSKAFDLHEAGLQRQQAVIRARDRLTYRISFSSPPASDSKPGAP
jgi:hypothetical protein